MIAPNPSVGKKHNHGPDRISQERIPSRARNSAAHSIEHDVEEEQVEKPRSLGKRLAVDMAQRVQQGVTDKASTALKNYILAFVMPVRSLLATAEMLPGVSIAVKSLENWLADNLQGYMDRTGMKLNMSVHEAIDQLLRGNIEDFSDEFVSSMYNFIKDAVPDKIKDAFSSGNPLTIVSSLTSALSDNVNNITTQISSSAIPGNFITKPLRYIANFIPFVNKLPEVLKPAVGGVVGFLGLSFLWRMTKGIFKLALLGGAAFMGWRFFMGGKPAEAAGASAKAKLRVN